MKTAEELFSKYEEQYITDEDGMPFTRTNYPSGYVSKSDFTKALTEHDSEIKQIINEMIEEHKGTESEYALTELKQKIRSK